MKKFKLFWVVPGIILSIIGIMYWDPGQFVEKTYLRITGDYITPKLETTASIRQMTINDSIYYDRLYRLKNYSAFHELEKKHLTTIPLVQIYDKDKRMIKIASGSNCAWALMNLFSSGDSSKLEKNDSTMYELMKQELESIDLKTNADTFDYYILAGWANYLPKLSNGLFDQTNKMKRTLNKKICISYINFDMQKEWEAEMDSIDKMN